MGKPEMDERIDAAAELEDLLRRNSLSFRREGERFFLVFADRGCKWETVCVCRQQLVLIYGRYPFPVLDRMRAQEVCQDINRQVVFGSMFLSDGQAVFRTAADLFDPYSAWEHIARALEYNAGVMVRFWKQIASCTTFTLGDLGKEPASE